MVFYQLQRRSSFYGLKGLFVCLFTLLISACGFHLKGQLPIPQTLLSLKLVSLSGIPRFDQSLQKELTLANVTLLSESTQIDEQILELKVLKITFTDRVLSTASNNDVTEKERQLKASYFIRDHSGKSLYGPRTISVSRTLSNQNASDDTVLAYNNEQMQAMSGDLAKQLVNDLAYAPL